jgi:hypothetical protein
VHIAIRPDFEMVYPSDGDPTSTGWADEWNAYLDACQNELQSSGGVLILEPSGFFHRVIIEIRFAVHGEQHRSAGRRVVMQRARLAPDVISGRRHSIVIFDAAFQDERLLDFGMFVKRDVSAWFELE